MTEQPHSEIAPVIFVPRWRLFAYRAAGWTVSGALDQDFVELTWRGPEAPALLPPCLPSRETEASPVAAQADVA